MVEGDELGPAQRQRLPDLSGALEGPAHHLADGESGLGLCGGGHAVGHELIDGERRALLFLPGGQNDGDRFQIAFTGQQGGPSHVGVLGPLELRRADGRS